MSGFSRQTFAAANSLSTRCVMSAYWLTASVRTKDTRWSAAFEIVSASSSNNGTPNSR
ncbi:MAG TPA: hypothetical protein VND64_11380 [Pirellulales bacterium]|nr:hypothetical protein [Pirellulales bacterium]